MPLGRTSRNNKRPSSSYTSTLTTVVVVAFCVLAVWMLTSDTIVSPQFSGGGGTTPTDTSDKLQLDKPQQQEKPETTTNSDVTTVAVDTGDKKEESTASRTFQDSQGDLPRDALRNEDQTKEDNDLNKKDDENTTGVGVVEKTNQEEGQSGGGGEGDEGGKLVEENAVVTGGVENNAGGGGGLEEPKSNGDRRENEAGDGAGVAAEEVVNADMSGGGEDQNQQQVDNTGNDLGEDNNKESETTQLSTEESSTTTIQNQQQADDNGGQVVPEDRDNNNNNAAAGDANNAQQDNNDQASSNVAESGKTDESNSDQQDQAKQQDEANKLEDTSQDSSEQKAAAETNNNDEDNRSSNKSNSEPQQEPPDEQENNRDTESNHEKQQSTTTKQETTPTTDESTDSREEASSTTNQNLSTKEQQPNNKSSSQPKQLKTSTQDTKPTTEDDKTSTTLPNSGIPKESQESKAGWSTQAANSLAEKEKVASDTDEDGKEEDSSNTMYGYSWKLCNVTAGADYIPCLDNTKAIKKLRSTKQYQHRERHCPEDSSTCLVPTPNGYKTPITWPTSREKIWFNNVPHTGLAAYKGHQNWVKVEGEYITFPGGGTQFIHGALHYIDFINKAAPNIAWGRHTRVVLDVGCGVASFGGFLFDRDVLTMSFAPKDEHEAQVQFALERGIPAISSVMGSQRLPFPARVFDLVHCARCRVPWHMEGGRLLLELNRVLRPGGHFVWSATPVYQKLPQDVEIWEAMTKLTAKLCWQLVTIQRDTLNKVAAAIYRKPTKNECYDNREEDSPPMCKTDDDPNASWYVPIQGCMHRIPVTESERGTKWPHRWPKRLITPPYWLKKTQMGIYGKPAPEDFTADSDHWRYVVKNSYLKGLGISWEDVRNVMDMRAAYGGFAAALRDHKIWVMNVVNVNAPDTLPIIYERGLFGIYHDWCESFSTYPRTYDLLHADHLFSQLKKRCKLVPVMAEVDRIVRPGGKLIVRDESTAISEVENILKSLRWEVHLTFSKDQEGILSAQKSDWRPTAIAASADS